MNDPIMINESKNLKECVPPEYHLKKFEDKCKKIIVHSKLERKPSQLTEKYGCLWEYPF